MHKILIVDDEKPGREFIAKLLSTYLPEDSEIIKVGDPHTALELLQEGDFDILFLDVCMPSMTGLQLLETIRRQGKNPYTVIVSAYREFDYAVKGIELGVVQYLTKPLYPEKFSETIRSYLNHINTTTILLDTSKGIRRVKIEQIRAIQRVDRSNLKIYMTDAQIPFVKGALCKLLKLLPDHFHYIRRDCLLNYHAITEYNLKGQEVVIVCQNEEVTLEVSRENMKELSIWLKEK